MEIGSWADWFAGSMSALAVVVALSGYGLSERQRWRDRKDAQRAAGNQVLVKLLAIVNTIHSLHAHLTTQANNAQLQGPDGPEVWRMVQPMIGFSDEANIQFEAIEASIFIDAKQTEFLMDLLLLGRRHAALIASMQEYTIRRDALAKLTPTPVAFNGLVATTELTREDYMRMRPYALQVENLIRTIIEHCEADLTLANSVAARFGPIMQTLLGDRGYITLVIPDRAAGEPVGG